MLPGYNSKNDKRLQTYSGYTSPSNKHMMQNLYKNQLDDMVHEINERKQLERKKKNEEIVEFNKVVEVGKQNEKVKQTAYKNYYKMLLQNQDQYQSSYVSPYQLRDNLKKNHINYSMIQGEKRMQEADAQNRRRRQQLKIAYKEQLMKQLQERRAFQMKSRQKERREKEQMNKYRKLPSELDKFERSRHLEEMQKYKEDLDKMTQQNRQLNSRRKIQSDPNYSQSNSESHNVLTNPLPFNVQNPYILKQINEYKSKDNHPQRQHNSFHYRN